MSQAFLTLKALEFSAQGKRSAALGLQPAQRLNPNGVGQSRPCPTPLGLTADGRPITQGGAALALGSGL